MRTLAIEVGSTKGRARVYRVEGRVIVEVDLLESTRKRPEVWTTDAHDWVALNQLARRMQTTLDGVYGTNGDVAGYRQVLAYFEC